MNIESQVLQRVIDALEKYSIPYAIVGSTGASTWGLDRSTSDIDMITLVDGEHADEIISLISNEAFYVPESDARFALIHGGSFNVLHPEHGTKIDVFVAPLNDEFAQIRLSRRVQSLVHGIPAYVATAEDIVLAKLRWRLTTSSERQWSDCADLVARNTLDRPYLRNWANRLGLLPDLERLLDQVDSVS